MKRIFILAGCLLFCLIQLRAQETGDYSAIKLFLDQQKLDENNPDLSASQRDRLASKVTELINQTSITEKGYSDFLVVPRFRILSTSVDETGMAKIYLAECELSLTIERRSFSDQGAAVFASFSKRIMGSASASGEAASNAINSIQTTDNEIISFLQKSKEKISAYFKAHCADVIKEAMRASQLGDFAKSISIYFSVPADAPCYATAMQASVTDYKRYLQDTCKRLLLKLKSRAARTHDSDPRDTSVMASYDIILGSLADMGPACGPCYDEVQALIDKMEARFDEREREEWEMKKKSLSDETEVRKEMYKAMSRISNNYQPGNTPTVIIAH
jgi:hypothetical protein